VHARRPFFAMADLEENARRKAAGNKEIPLSPIAIEIVRRIDALFEIERSINGKSPEEQLAVRRNLSRPLADDLRVYMREQAARLSRTTWSKPSITFSSAGRPSPCSSRMGAFVFRTTPPSEGCAASLLEENHGCSAGPIAAVDVLRPCTVSSSRRR
jgi:hypothetical protein